MNAPDKIDLNKSTGTDPRHDPTRVIRAPRGTELNCKSWLTEAPFRMLQNNLDPDVAEDPKSLVVYGDFYFESGVSGMEKLLALDAPPTAVFVASDMMAMGAMRAIQANGLSIPGDVAVIGFDDIAIAGMAHPSLSTIRQEKAQLGELAAEALLRQMDANGDEDGDDPAANQLLPVTLVVRESTCGDRTEAVT